MCCGSWAGLGERNGHSWLRDPGPCLRSGRSCRLRRFQGSSSSSSSSHQLVTVLGQRHVPCSLNWTVSARLGQPAEMPQGHPAPCVRTSIQTGSVSGSGVLNALERCCSRCPHLNVSFFDYAYTFSKRKQVFSSGPWLHRSGIKIVHSSLFVSGLQVLIIISIFPTLGFIPATAYFWFMLLASSSFCSFSQAPDLPPTVTAALQPFPGPPCWLLMQPWPRPLGFGPQTVPMSG